MQKRLVNSKQHVVGLLMNANMEATALTMMDPMKVRMAGASN